MSKGKLIRVERAPGQFVKMYEADAVAQGYIKAKTQPENKMQPAPQNKMRLPEEDKGPEPVQADDFTTIPGIGPATARALVAHGVTTFDQLKDAGELDYLTAKAIQAIGEWRSNGTN